MCRVLEAVGIHVERQHHEVATAGQAEIDIKFDSLVKCADNLQWFKYIIKNVARRHGKTVTFMPKPLYGDNGSGMHCHFSLWKGEKNNFFGDGYANLSQQALWAIGGILRHAASILAISNPTTNSYRRLVPGYEAPVNLVYSARNRSAAVRIPMYSDSPKAKRIEFRCPDATANPYLAFAAMLMAGLDGIERGLDAGEPADFDLFEEDRGVAQVPGSLEATLDALEADHEFLLRGDVFPPELIEAWISYKREQECDAVRLRPHPAEFALYYDA
jgi:glutamine synthetase